MKTIIRENVRIKFFKEDGKNKIHFEENCRKTGEMNHVGKNWGNFWFKSWQNLNEKADTESFIDSMWLDYCAFNDDYDFFSDLYKDVFHFRPHYTEEQWKERVKTARNRKI